MVCFHMKKKSKQSSKKAKKKLVKKASIRRPPPSPPKTTPKKATPKKAAAKKAVPKKAAPGRAIPGKAVPKKTLARKTGAGLMAPLTPSAELASVIGTAAIPRSEIIKKIWDYIRKNNLQDSANKRMINADVKLKPLFEGKAQISMFDLAKIVAKNVK